MTEALEQADAPSDAALIAAVRAGDTAAYGVLYERHLGAARRAALSLAGTTAEREDLVAEAFTRVLRVVRNGRGPTEEFRPYLLVTMRNVAINAHRGGPEIALYGEVPDDHRLAGNGDPHGDRAHAEVAAEAFASLPERWRTVLWHTEVEGDSPAQVAPLLGLSPNSVAALAYRAREGLRQAYLQQYLPAVDRRECRTVSRQLAGWVRRGIAVPKMRRINAHLDRCVDCRRLADRLSKINDELRGIIGPVVLGAPLALGYLATSTGSAATSGTVLAATVAQTSGATAGYLTAVKTIVAGTAIATAAAVTTVLPPPQAPVQDRPAVSAPATERTRPDRPGSAQPVDRDQPGQPGSVQPAGLPDPTAATTDPAAPPAGTADSAEQSTTDTSEADAERQAAKEQRQADKAAAKEAKADAKAARKAAKEDAASATTDGTK